MKNLTDFKFDGLAWSNDKDFSVMFDGLVDIGVGYFNNMGKQESVYTFSALLLILTLCGITL